MYCSNCGKEIAENAAVCLGCGVAIDAKRPAAEGRVSAGWWWLGFFVPIAGFLIWALCNDTEPQKAKKAGIGAIVGIVTSIVLAVLVYAICIGLMLLPVFLLDSSAYYL